MTAGTDTPHVTAPRNLRRTARRSTTVARLIVATTVVAAAGAGLATGSAGAGDVPRPLTLVAPADTAPTGLR